MTHSPLTHQIGCGILFSFKILHHFVGIIHQSGQISEILRVMPRIKFPWQFFEDIHFQTTQRCWNAFNLNCIDSRHVFLCHEYSSGLSTAKRPHWETLTTFLASTSFWVTVHQLRLKKKPCDRSSSGHLKLIDQGRIKELKTVRQTQRPGARFPQVPKLFGPAVSGTRVNSRNGEVLSHQT